ncbi:hypothetical protein B0H11DRAFT_2263121 [Mycena galericulata]|nr:hypothetical protein B0H11DRAFT_2263121 [Mycena galericulata]
MSRARRRCKGPLFRPSSSWAAASETFTPTPVSGELTCTFGAGHVSFNRQARKCSEAPKFHQLQPRARNGGALDRVYTLDIPKRLGRVNFFDSERTVLEDSLMNSSEAGDSACATSSAEWDVGEKEMQSLQQADDSGWSSSPAFSIASDSHSSSLPDSISDDSGCTVCTFLTSGEQCGHNAADATAPQIFIFRNSKTEGKLRKIGLLETCLLLRGRGGGKKSPNLADLAAYLP